jgi:hypothetical protein
VVRADDKLTAFIELEAAIRRAVIAIISASASSSRRKGKS